MITPSFFPHPFAQLMEPNHSGDSMYGNNGWPPNQPMPLIPPFLYYPFVLFVPQPNMMQPSSNIGPLRQQYHPPMSGPIRNRRQDRSHPEVPHHYQTLPQLSGRAIHELTRE